MKLIAVPILILLLMTQAFSKWVLILNYRINKEYIAKNLCENKARPQLHCNGKCQLLKQLKAEEEKESAPVKSSNTYKVSFNEVWFDGINNFEFIPLKGKGKAPEAGFYQLKKYSTLLQMVFRPPLG